MPQNRVAVEHEELLKKALEQPGLAELMQVYGQYQELIRQSEAYLAALQPLSCISDNTNTG